MTTKARITLQVALIIAAVATPASAARQTLTASYDRVMLDRNKTSEANLLRSSIPLRESSSNSSWNRSESDSENKNGPFHNEANSRGTLEWRHQDKAISLGNPNGLFPSEPNSRGILEWRHQDTAISLGNPNGLFTSEPNSRGTLEWRHQDKAISLGNPINPANRDVVEQQQQIQRTQEAFARTLEQLSMERSVNAGCMLQIERELAERELMLSAIEDKCQKQGDKLLATINRNKEENKQWQLEKQKLQARVNQQQQQLDTLSEEVSRCRRQCQQAQEKNAKQQEALNELRQSLYAERAKTAAAYRGKAEQAKAYKDEIREKARYIACLEAKVRRGQLDTKVGAAEYEDEKAELTIRIAQATEQINALEQKMQSLQEAADKERDNGAHIIEQLEIKKSEALNRIRQLEQEMEVQSQNIAELNKQCREQDTVIQELTNTLRRSNANGREKEIQCSTERTQLRADIYAFRRQADIWRERTLEQLDEYMRMTGERNRKEAAILQENRELHTRSEALLRDAAAHDVEVLKQQEETEHLRQEYEHLQQECEHLRQNLNLQQQENEKFRNQELALKQLLRDTAAHDVEVLKQQEETEQLRQECEHLRQECEHLRQNLNLQQQENEKFRNQELALKQLRAVLGNLSTGIA